MAATYGHTDIQVTPHDILRFNWNEDAQDYGKNESKVGWALSLISDGYGAIYSNPSREWYVNIDGQEYSGSGSVAIGNNETKILAHGQTTVKHNVDGSKTFSYSFSQVFNITFSDVWRGKYSGSGTGTLNPIPRAATITNATDFNDEQNPTITFSNPAGNAVESLRACIDFDSTISVAAYRDIDKTKTSGTYTFTLTDAERHNIRANVTGSNSRNIWFHLETTIGGVKYYSSVKTTTVTIINNKPTLIPSVKDIHIPSLQLTGDDTGQTVIKGINIMEYDIGATAYKEATIEEQYVICGSKKKTDPTGEISNAESNIFEFYVRDSRGNELRRNLTLKFVDYITLTCHQELSIDLVEETEAQVKLTVKGNYYTGSFGAQNNQLWLKYKYSADGGEYSDWFSIDSNEISIDETNNTYTATTYVTGLDYNKSYMFVSRAADMPMIEQTNEYPVKLIPVFDWGENDFNFNVPIAIQGNPVADFVIEQGVNNGWRYTKWLSGKIEMDKTITLRTTITEQKGSLFRTTALTATLPFTVYSARYWLDVTDGNTWASTARNANDISNIRYILWCVWSAAEQDFSLDCRVIGRWK